MSLNELTASVQERMGSASLTGTLKFDLGETGVIFVDATQSPPVINNEDTAAACTVKVTADDFRDMMNGDLDAQAAFMMGKLQIEGDMGVAMQLAGAL